jgi:hypothetical protein
MSRLRVMFVALAGLALVPVGQILRGQQPPTSTTAGKPEATPARITQLITQLGSDRFTKREQAARALQGMGVAALPALREAATKGGDAEIRRRAGGLVACMQNSPEALALEYQQYHLPLPPAGAPLVRYSTPETSLAFLLRPRARKTPAELLQGLSRLTPREGSEITPIDPTRLTSGAMRELVRTADLDPVQALALALQCQARGWDVLARILLERIPGLMEEREDGWSLRGLLLEMAWGYWECELGRPGADWVLLRQRLQALLDAGPEVDTQVNRHLLRSLAAALAPRKSRPGNIEALIDDLIEARSSWGGEDTVHGMNRQWEDPEGDGGRFDRLVGRGFDVVPQLIDHLGDDRLTRYHSVGINNAQPFFLRVGELAELMLRGIAAGGLDVTGKITPAQARAWWRQAQSVGEERYYVVHIFPDKRFTHLEHAALLVLTRKYPGRLPVVYREILDHRPSQDSRELAEAIAHSRLARATKVDLLARAARHPLFRHRCPALTWLSEIDPPLFAERLVEELSIPHAKAGEDRYYPRVPALAGFVRETSDPRAWQQLEKLARESVVGDRLRYIDGVGMTWRGAADPHRREQMRFLAAFLDDATAARYDVGSEKDTSGWQLLQFTRLEVRDLAAMRLAELLGLHARPEDEWTAAQWSALRQPVREALRTRR